MNRFALLLVGMVFAAGAGLSAEAKDFRLTSPQIAEGGVIAMEQVFGGFGCTGKNISPQLDWSGAPQGAKSFALSVYDPDAPTGSGWWHWVMFNIPASVSGLPKDAGNVKAGLAPEGAVQSRTDFGETGYGGPCPPEGDKPHRYIFTLHALKLARLPLDRDAPAAMVGFYVNANSLGKASLTARFSR